MQKQRPVEDIRRDLQDAKGRIEEIRRLGNGAISAYDLMMGYDAKYYLQPNSLLFSHVACYEQELEEATRHGEQRRLDF